MSEMTDPMNALVQLQLALDARAVSPAPCEIHKDILVIADQPNGSPRYTYIKHCGNKAHAIALFALTEQVEGLPCFQMGWATLEAVRGRGFASDVTEKGIKELIDGLKRAGIAKFYLEAIISESNHPSIKLGHKLLSNSPKKCTDSFSGESALQFLRGVS
jgi:hypothetical protein